MLVVTYVLYMPVCFLNKSVIFYKCFIFAGEGLVCLCGNIEKGVQVRRKGCRWFFLRALTPNPQARQAKVEERAGGCVLAAQASSQPERASATRATRAPMTERGVPQGGASEKVYLWEKFFGTPFVETQTTYWWGIANSSQ